MSCATQIQQPIRFVVSMGSLPEGFCGTPQQLAQAIADRLIITGDQNNSSFVTGSVAPTSNVGPWLKDCLTWYVFDDASGTYVPMTFPTIASVGTGMIIPWSGTFANIPSGYLACDGMEYANTAFPALYNLIGTSYGTSTPFSFKVPDMRNRFWVGAQQDNANLAKSSVSDGATLLKNRDFTAHTHPVSQSVSGASTSGPDPSNFVQNVAIGNDTPHAIPPFMSLVAMIKT